MWIDVQTGKKVDEVITGRSSGELLVRVKPPPKEGRANKAVRIIIAKHFETAPSDVEVIKGFKSKRKLIEVALRTIHACSHHDKVAQSECGEEIDSFSNIGRSGRIREAGR